MSSYETLPHIPAAQASETDRAAFVGLVYQHIAAAVAAFVAFEVILFATGIADSMRDFFFGVGGGGGRWLLMLGGVMIIQWFSANAAADLQNPPRQYIGLFGSAFAQALIFAPFLSYVFQQSNGGATVAQAAIITGIGFAMLTAIGLFTRKDLSFLRPIVMWGFGLALLAILGGVLFGFALGTWFSVAMIGLSGASILFQTQNVVRRYPIGSHVAASIALFTSLMTMFWYVLRLLMSRD
ncbi:MAG: Bax inhibitor-1 family protein [Acidimicrobiia bacterium]|nr:Bax inhibitor-1 family protein [Acidimicrobiia bacterium]